MLHDIGTAIDYEDHHRHSHYLILNAGLPGFTPRELVLVGLIARYHRKGEPDASELGDLGGAPATDAAAAAVRDHPPGRAARAQPRRCDPAGAAWRRANGAVALDRRGRPARATRASPIWAARRNADLLADALGRAVEIAASDRDPRMRRIAAGGSWPAPRPACSC